jgi:hypothetical protein
MKQKQKLKKFFCDDIDIFLHYNKKFKLPKCVRMRKECLCFRYEREIDFYFEYPICAILSLKKYIRKTLCEIKKHNNYDVISLLECANFTRKIDIRTHLRDHKKTLKIFEMCYQKMNKKKKHFLRYMIYIDTQMKRCNDLLGDINTWELSDRVPMFQLTSILYSHYHTLNLFEKFVK